MFTEYEQRVILEASKATPAKLALAFGVGDNPTEWQKTYTPCPDWIFEHQEISQAIQFMTRNFSYVAILFSSREIRDKIPYHLHHNYGDRGRTFTINVPLRPANQSEFLWVNPWTAGKALEFQPYDKRAELQMHCETLPQNVHALGYTAFDFLSARTPHAVRSNELFCHIFGDYDPGYLAPSNAITFLDCQDINALLNDAQNFLLDHLPHKARIIRA